MGETAREVRLSARSSTVGKLCSEGVAPSILTQDSVLLTTTALGAVSVRRVADSDTHNWTKYRE